VHLNFALNFICRSIIDLKNRNRIFFHAIRCLCTSRPSSSSPSWTSRGARYLACLRLLSAVCCLLSAVRCVLSAVRCLLPCCPVVLLPCCPLSTVCCPLSAVCCLLSAVCCPVVCCLLPTRSPSWTSLRARHTELGTPNYRSLCSFGSLGSP
jgi:hypothetical protein